MTTSSGRQPAGVEQGLHRHLKVDVSTLREFGSQLPPESALRHVLLLEKDDVSASDFLARLPIYLALADKTLER